MSSALDFDAAVRLAFRLSILDQGTGVHAPFLMNDEQREVLRALIQHQRVVVLKARQQGISTVACLLDLLHAVMNPGQSVAIVADTADKSSGLLAKIAAWVRELAIPLEVDNVTRLRLANGSTIDALSAVSHAEGGESRTGRSKSYGLIHASELAFWYNDAATMAALLSTALPSSRVIIESTASPAENLFRSIWDKANNGWHHIFLSVERHVAYQLPAESVTDERFAELADGYGFTSRTHAAWWDAKLRTDLGADVHRALREYPIRAEQAFSFAEGRWIFRYRPVEPLKTEGHWRIYRDVEMERDPAWPVILGADTGAGVGGDNSAIAIICQRTGSVVATWVDNKTSVPDFIEVIGHARARFKPLVAVVESNGIGGGAYQYVRRQGGPTKEQWTEKGEKPIRFAHLREDIESGVIGAGPELQREIKGSVVDRNGKFDGPDDLLNAVSFANEYRRAHPYVAPPPTFDPQVFVVPDAGNTRHVF